MPRPLPLITDLVHHLELFASLLLTDGNCFRACVTRRSQTIELERSMQAPCLITEIRSCQIYNYNSYIIQQHAV
jgi:hypothetical protein